MRWVLDGYLPQHREATAMESVRTLGAASA